MMISKPTTRNHGFEKIGEVLPRLDDLHRILRTEDGEKVIWCSYGGLIPAGGARTKCPRCGAKLKKA